ncbi:MAG: flavin reductase family protein [Actinomycetota bacterium]
MQRSFPAFADKLDYPLFIVTSSDGTERAGCLVGFATQCSIHPPRFLVCISHKNRTFHVACRSDVLVVHLVAREQMDLAELFGGETGDTIDKFSRCEWREGPGGAPVLARCGNWFAARIIARVDAGDHMCLLVEPFDMASGDDASTLTYQRAKSISPGHEA